MGEQETVISTHGLTKRYGKKTALDGLSIELKRGHIYGLVGDNGSGKTTLLRVLTGLSPRYGGTVEILGRSDRKGLLRSRKSMAAGVAAEILAARAKRRNARPESPEPGSDTRTERENGGRT